MSWSRSISVNSTGWYRSRRVFFSLPPTNLWKQQFVGSPAADVSHRFEPSWSFTLRTAVLITLKLEGQRSGQMSLKRKVNSHLGVSENCGTPKSSHFNRVFHFKPSILGYPYFWKHPFVHDSKKDSLRNHISNLLGFHQHESKILSTNIDCNQHCFVEFYWIWDGKFWPFWHTDIPLEFEKILWINMFPTTNRVLIKNASLIIKTVQPPKRKSNKSERWTSCNIVRSCRCLQSPKVHRFGLASKVLDEKP